MAAPTLAELAQAAADADGPRFAAPRKSETGGVDPLGLRQINFDLMDRVLPGINNVARHLRPFVVTAWAWRRAATCGLQAGHAKLPVDLLRDFVDRVEVIYAWSHFLKGKADLPGGDVLAPLVQSASYTFGGADWERRREVRSRSTGFMAAINYGPALRILGWIEPDPDGSGAMCACRTPTVQAALDAFEACIMDRVGHPAFSILGEVTVTAAEARAWLDGWAMDRPTEAEKAAMRLALADPASSRERSAGISLMLAAVDGTGTTIQTLRRAMCEPPAAAPHTARLEPTRLAWRRMQVRQAFRLALEALLHWTTFALHGRPPRGTATLVEVFLGEVPDRPAEVTADEWLAGTDLTNPVDAMEALQGCLAAPGAAGLAAAITNALAFCLREAPAKAESFESSDRLPLARARREWLAWGKESASAFLRHVFESWVLAQHVYWAVGRGLADARAGGKTLLRLRVVLEEDGWTLAPGMPSAGPLPTADRLETAMSLARECGLVPAAFESAASAPS